MTFIIYFAYKILGSTLKQSTEEDGLYLWYESFQSISCGRQTTGAFGLSDFQFLNRSHEAEEKNGWIDQLEKSTKSLGLAQTSPTTSTCNKIKNSVFSFSKLGKKFSSTRSYLFSIQYVYFIVNKDSFYFFFSQFEYYNMPHHKRTFAKLWYLTVI